MHLLIDDQKPRNLSAMPSTVFSSSLLKESSDCGLMFYWNTRKGIIDRGTDLLQANHWHCEAHPLLHLSSSASWPWHLTLTFALPPCRPWDLLKTSKHLKASLWAALHMYDLGSKRFQLKNSLLALLGFKKHFRFPPQNRAYLCRWSFQLYPQSCNFKKRNWTTL